VTSDREAGRTKVCLPFGQHLFIPYMREPAKRGLQIGIRADDILLSTRPPQGIYAGNVLPGVVQSIKLNEGQEVIAVAAGVEFYVRLTAAAVSRLQLTEQSAVFLIMKTRSLRVI
jgi:molybdate transport system ATP-binding protein